MSVPQIIITAYSVPIYTYNIAIIKQLPARMRDALHRAVFVVERCPSVCPTVHSSVRLSHAGIVSKRLKLSENFFDHLVDPSF